VINKTRVLISLTTGSNYDFFLHFSLERPNIRGISFRKQIEASPPMSLTKLQTKLNE
jgi:hypothetical protein